MKMLTEGKQGWHNNLAVAHGNHNSLSWCSSLSFGSFPWAMLKVYWNTCLLANVVTRGNMVASPASTSSHAKWTAMPCAPRSHLVLSGFGDRDRWLGPRPARPPPLQFSCNYTITISVRVSQKNACQAHSHSILLWENKPRWEKAKKKRRLIFR